MAGKPVESELALFLENVNELSIPYMSTYWSRQFSVVDYQVTGGLGIGLFSYLYHDYITAIGAACVQGQGHWSEQPNADMRCYALANNLVRGLIPGPFITQVPLESDKSWESQVSKAYFSYCQPYAHFPEYLLLGKCCPPPKIECNDNQLTFWREDHQNGAPQKKDGVPLSKIKTKLPAIANGAFEATDGSKAVVCVNTTNANQTAHIHPPPNRKIEVYSSRRVVEKHIPASHNPKSIRLDFQPYGVKVLIME